MAKIEWFPTGRVGSDDNPGFLWIGVVETGSVVEHNYSRTFQGTQYAECLERPADGPLPPDKVRLLRWMGSMLPLEEAANVPYSAHL